MNGPPPSPPLCLCARFPGWTRAPCQSNRVSRGSTLSRSPVYKHGRHGNRCHPLEPGSIVPPRHPATRRWMHRPVGSGSGFRPSAAAMDAVIASARSPENLPDASGRVSSRWRAAWCLPLGRFHRRERAQRAHTFCMPGDRCEGVGARNESLPVSARSVHACGAVSGAVIKQRHVIRPGHAQGACIGGPAPCAPFLYHPARPAQHRSSALRHPRTPRAPPS